MLTTTLAKQPTARACRRYGLLCEMSLRRSQRSAAPGAAPVARHHARKSACVAGGGSAAVWSLGVVVRALSPASSSCVVLPGGRRRTAVWACHCIVAAAFPPLTCPATCLTAHMAPATIGRPPPPRPASSRPASIPSRSPPPMRRQIPPTLLRRHRVRPSRPRYRPRTQICRDGPSRARCRRRPAGSQRAHGATPTEFSVHS